MVPWVVSAWKLGATEPSRRVGMLGECVGVVYAMLDGLVEVMVKRKEGKQEGERKLRWSSQVRGAKLQEGVRRRAETKA